MDPHTPFRGPYMNGPPPWHLGGHFVYPFNDDSGYASSDSDSPPLPSFDPDDNIHDGIDQLDHVSPWPRYRQNTAFVNAQYLHPVAAFRLQHPYHISSNETYDLPPPLPFEQQRRNYQYASQPNTTPSYHRRNRDREPSHTSSLQDFTANTTSSLNFNTHSARLPATLPPLHDRVLESESEVSSPPLPRPSTPIRHDASFPDNNNPELKANVPPQHMSSSPTLPLSPRNPGRTGEDLPPAASADGPRRHDSSSSSSSSLSDGGQRKLVAAWRHLYRERRVFEEEKRAFGKAETLFEPA